MLAPFPLKGDEAKVSAKLRAKGYLTSLAGQPLWAVKKAKEQALRGGLGGDPRFAPTPPQVFAAVQEAMKPARAGLTTVRQLLSAKTAAPEITQDERDKVMRKFAELRSGLKRTA